MPSASRMMGVRNYFSIHHRAAIGWLSGSHRSAGWVSLAGCLSLIIEPPSAGCLGLNRNRSAGCLRLNRSQSIGWLSEFLGCVVRPI
jgi:hypothetical protein